jgi:hypothetical protein
VRYCALTRLTPQKPRGRHSLLSTPLSQRLVSYATASLEQRLKSLRQIAHELNINVDQRTLTKAFVKDGYHRRVATEKPLLINGRLWWAATCVALPQLIWNRVIWSDEASFKIGRGKVYITRRAEEKYLQACCAPKFKSYSSVMVWACIGRDGSKSSLLVWN